MNDTEKVNVSTTFFGTVEVPKGASGDEIEALVWSYLEDNGLGDCDDMEWEYVED